MFLASNASNVLYIAAVGSKFRKVTVALGQLSVARTSNFLPVGSRAVY
jgi:hypothetical protein